MPETDALQAWIDAQNAASLISRMATAEQLLKQQAALIAKLAGTVTPPVPVPVPLPTILWSAGMQTGNLSEWSEQVISGSALSSAVQAVAEGIPPRTTPWVLKQSVTGASGGTRMQRYPEIDKLARAGTAFWYSFWSYFPSPVSFGISDMFQLISINSTDPGGVADPIWGLFVTPSGFMPSLGWSPNDRAPAAGPHAGEAGKRFYASTTPIPVGAWTFFELYLKPSADFTGALQFYMNRNLVFDLSAIKTMHPVGAALPQWIDKDAYGSGLTPTPYSHYSDDFTISLGRMP